MARGRCCSFVKQMSALVQILTMRSLFSLEVASVAGVVREEDSFHKWDYPACWETSWLKSTLPSALPEYDRIVVVGDIHGHWDGLIEVLDAAGVIVPGQCDWKEQNERVILIQTGDVVDRGRFSLECHSCLRHLQDTAKSYGHLVIRLLGNHELMWLGSQYDFRNKDTDTMENINFVCKQLVMDIMDRKLLGSFFIDSFGGVPILFSHAGVRRDLKALITKKIDRKLNEFREGADISAFINDKLHDDITTCSISRSYSESYSGQIRCGIFLVDDIYSVGEERGGKGIGGVMWTDFKILQNEATETFWQFVQVVGHTMRKNIIRSTERLRSVCVDAGLMVGGRAYLSIEPRGRFYSHSKRRVEWIMTDLTARECDGLN